MALELKVPEVGESITEVEIGEWLFAEGDAVNKEDTVVMIETDKVTVELVAPASGKVTKILKNAGDSAGVGEVIGYMEEGAAADQPGAGKSSGKKAAGKGKGNGPAQKNAKASPSASAGKGDGKGDGPSARAPQSGLGEVVAMPAAQRVLAEKGLTADAVEGTGRGGRVLKEDAARADQAPAPREESPSPAGASWTRGAASREEEVVPMTPLRRRVAERLVHAQQSMALLTTFNEVDMSAVMALRAQYKDTFRERYDIKLGFMSFFVKAAVEALKAFPAVNGSIDGDNIVYHNYFDIGVAVGGGKGLVVPVIRNAEHLSFAEIEKTIADYGARAQSGRLRLDELQGGTFTISNGGVYGSMMSTPIVNPPQSGILGLHAIQERAVVIKGAVQVRPMMYVALSYDHRIIDGREAVSFLVRIKECIESPARILLEI